MDRGSQMLEQVAKLLAPDSHFDSLGPGFDGDSASPHRRVFTAVPRGRAADSSSSPSAAAGADSVALAFLHDEAATSELIDLLAAARGRELAQLEAAAALLEAEKRLRGERVAALRVQADALAAQRRQILAPFGAGRDDDGAASVASGSNPEARAGRLLGGGGVTGDQQYYLSMSPQNLRQRGGGTSQQEPPSPNAWNNANNYLRTGAAAGYAASASGSGQNVIAAAPLTQGPPGSDLPLAGGARFPNGTRRHVDVPGVSFGTLTTASCATRYAKHWTREAQSRS